jgi:hypothetical protein
MSGSRRTPIWGSRRQAVELKAIAARCAGRAALLVADDCEHLLGEERVNVAARLLLRQAARRRE